MRVKKGYLRLVAAMAVFSQPVASASDLWTSFVTPPDESKTKVWWFHGETETTKEGIDADLEAFREKGVGGVVFYDQVHGKAADAYPAMSPQWWDMLKYAARKAKELNLTFEVAASNGYVAGGPWITPELSMKETVFSDTLLILDKDSVVNFRLASPAKDFVDVATVMFPDNNDLSPISVGGGEIRLSNNASYTVGYASEDSEIEINGISYTVNPRGKGSTGSMNIPGKPSERYFGAKYTELPPIGSLEYSADGSEWHEAAKLPAIEAVIWHKSKRRTISFPAVRGRYFRIRIQDWLDSEGKQPTLVVGNIRLYTRDITDHIEVKSGLRTEVIYPSETGGNKGAIKLSEVRDITGFVNKDGSLSMPVEKGRWRIIRFGYKPTGARTKHGRKNLLGYEADVMSAEAAKVHFQHYFKAISDTLEKIGCKPQGMCMDSHEAGIQNWTQGFEKSFKAKSGYDIVPWIPALAGYIVNDRKQTDQMLLDFRKSIAAAIAENYYGTFASLCAENGVTFTSQAMLNICNDNIMSRGQVHKPQGEFWAYQTNGNYDCLDAASSAHLYGHPIASGEAFTDTPYSETWEELLRIANLAYCKGINEFVVCASSYQPWADRKFDDSASSHPYVFHRHNPRWPEVGPFWMYQARCSQMLREGRPVVDLCVYIGEDVPCKTFAYKLPEIPEGFNFDVCSTDALLNRFYVGDGDLHVKGGMSYKVLLIQDRTYISPAAEQKIRELERDGARIVRCTPDTDLSKELSALGLRPDVTLSSAGEPDDRVCFFHRSTEDADIYFVYNHSPHPYAADAAFRTAHSGAEVWDPVAVTRNELKMSGRDKTVKIELAPYQSKFYIFRR